MQAAPLLQWSDPVVQFIGFAASFLATGAVGFRFAVVRDRLTRADRAVHGPDVYRVATQRAGVLGLAGVVVQAAIFLAQLPGSATKAHLSVSQLLTTDWQTAAECALLAASIVGFALAARRRNGWAIAVAGVIAGPLVVIFTGQWSRLVNPLHELFAGLWIGTLFVLVVAGLPTVMNKESSREASGAIAAEMVNRFSPLALTCGALLVLSGLTTAFLHLNPFSSLWTTPYGYALLVKLTLVSVVFGLGAWNWRRVRPRLGTVEAARTVRRSAAMELAVATLVLVTTAILVSLPSPRPPRPATPPPASQRAPSPRSAVA